MGLSIWIIFLVIIILIHIIFIMKFHQKFSFKVFYEHYKSNEVVEGEKGADFKIDSNKKTVVFVHGFNATRQIFTNYAERLQENYNFIVVNWLDGSNLPNICYPIARNRVKAVGSAVGKFLCQLVQLGMKLSQLVIIGHSLGAHISGKIGRYIYANTNQKVGQIIALDPAMPLFSTFGPETDDCIHKSDAAWVTVIHTSPLGIRKRLGHIDLYPNGGLLQADCEGGFVERILCSHSSANNIFLEHMATLLAEG